MNTKIEKTIIYGVDDIDEIADYLISLFDRCSVFTFTGSLGAGKTTLVSTLLRKAGVHDVVTSPTFTYVNVYANDDNKTFYHFDCYRLTSLDDFVTAGFDEYLYRPNSLSFIEWPEIVMPLLASRVCHVSLNYHGFDQRMMHIVVE